MSSDTVRGYVLAGGESSRMQRSDLPRDKALLLLDGETLLRRALRTLSEVCASTSILCGTADRCERLAPYGRTVRDRAVACGPLGGLDAALNDAVLARAEAVLIMPVDMPHLPANALATLLEQARYSGAAVSCLRAEGRAQPLPAYVHTGSSLAVAKALEVGDRKLLPVLQRIALESGMSGGFQVVDAEACGSTPVEVQEWFVNVNTPDDLLAAHRPETLETRLHLSRHGG